MLGRRHAPARIRPPWLRAILFAFALTTPAALSTHPAMADDGARASATADEAPPGEHELLSRLVAPCCWTQTLDVHEGGAPDELRAEIRQRLRAGESPESIESDFVARYGERVRASGGSTALGSASLLVIGLSIASAIALALSVRRWAKASPRTLESQARTSRSGDAQALALAGGPPDALDLRIDDELRDLDG